MRWRGEALRFTRGLHEEIGGWSYQRVSAYSGLVAPEGDKRRHVAAGLGWLSDGVIIGAQLSTTETTAMVNPRSFTLGMMRAAEQHGARLHHGEVTGVVRRGETVAGVDARRRDDCGGRHRHRDGAVVSARGDLAHVAAGLRDCKAPAWSTTPARMCLPRPSFLSTARRRNAVTVEVFPRADGSTHVCAFSGQAPLPMNPADVKPDPRDIARLQALCERLSPAFRPDRIIARQACFRPVTQDGLPLIGKVPGSEGAYIATGHSVWGILNAPATGEAMAELIAEGGAKTTDLTPFDPARLRPLDPASIRIA